MPLVNVLVNGRAYTVACDEGEEKHLREVAEFLDKRVQELVSTVGQVGDSRLLLMAALLVSDELSDALARIGERDKEIETLKASGKTSRKSNSSQNQDVLTDTLEKAAARLEAIAGRLAEA